MYMTKKRIPFSFIFTNQFRTNNMQITIRPITQSDNPILSRIIKDVFREFDCAKEGTVFTDPTTDHLYEVFQAKDSLCWVAEEDGISTS